MKHTFTYKQGAYTLRSMQEEDFEAYYEAGFLHFDAEIARLTGSKASYTKEEVAAYFQRCLTDETRYDFLLVDEDDQILGESVINDWDKTLRSANFRICLFHADKLGQGIGSWAVCATRDFAFEELHLHRLSLDVFVFNPRAKRAYEKASFRVEGVLRDALWDEDHYADDILMSLLEDEWKAQKAITPISENR